MAYNAHVWRNRGEANAIPINKTNLNEMERGISNANNILDEEMFERQLIDDEHSNRLDAIEVLLPNAASALNQLADKEFVNSSIATNTGVFRGTFSSSSQLPTTGCHNNDYAIVSFSEGGNTGYDRWKYNGTAWVFEYRLNNSSWTAAQMEAVNSGINASLVSSLPQKEVKSNRVNTITSASDNNHYPTAKAVYDLFNSIAIYQGEVV